jgi:GNAT superfamily N-acetyltransferase
MSLAVQVPPVENQTEQVLALLDRIGDGSRAVADGRLHFLDLHDNLIQLENLIFRLDGKDETVATIFAALTPEIISGLNDTYSFWQTTIESQFAKTLIKGEASLSNYLFYDRFDALVRRELALLSIARPQRTLFIGNGPLPLSAILVHLHTGVPVDYITRDSEAELLARQVVEKSGFDASVRILDSADIDNEILDYDLIIVGLLVRSKKAILKKLRKRCRPGCEILCRSTHGLSQLLCAATPDRDLRGFHIKKQQIAEGAQTISTSCLEPAGSAAADVTLKWLSHIDSNMAAQILRLMNRTLEEETTIGFPGPIDQETGCALMGQLGADVEAGRRHVLVAEKDDGVVGQLILTPNFSPNHRHIVELTRGTIDPSFRGGGLSLRAFHEVAKKCDELGREVICLDVRAGTMAALWWQHYGFKPYGLLRDYSRVGDKRYQGLYLTQTAAALKQRLKELAATPSSRSDS